MAKRTLLVDADIVAYQCAAALEEAVEWHPGFWTWNVDFNHVVISVEHAIREMKERFEADRVRLCLSDPHHNFRKDVLPTYKTHRATVRKPLVLMHVKDYLIENHGAVLVPGLEGDDVLGILATRKTRDEKIVVSLDKDLKTIPCNYVRSRAFKNEDGIEIVGAWDVQTVSEDEANHWFLTQTLTGDSTDGYKGCPGIGEKTAKDILEFGATIADNWKAVVGTFAKKGLGEEEALRQARCARILRAEDYDFVNKEVKLWTPQS